MHPNERIPTAAELESRRRKVMLILSMAGTSTDMAMNVLVYALAARAFHDGVPIAEVVENYTLIYNDIKEQSC